MQNVVMNVKGSKLTIEVDLSKEQGKSKSGKTVIVASTQGNQPIADTGAIIGLNIYRKGD